MQFAYSLFKENMPGSQPAEIRAVCPLSFAAASTAAKVVALSNYALATGGIVSVKFTNAVPANATLNINSKGAKSIYYNGSAIKAGIINAGDTATFIYDGTQYHVIAIDSIISKALKLSSYNSSTGTLYIVS